MSEPAPAVMNTKPRRRYLCRAASPRPRGRPSLREFLGEGNAHGPDHLDKRSFVKGEAETIFALVVRGVETVDSARALLAVPPRVRALLIQVGFRRPLIYRDAVAVEFEALVERGLV